MAGVAGHNVERLAVWEPAIERRPNDLLPLGYATPVADSESRLKRLPPSQFAATVGTAIGVFGVVMLLSGIHGIVSLARNWRAADGGDILAVTACNVVGALSVTLAVRWIRSTTIPPFD